MKTKSLSLALSLFFIFILQLTAQSPYKKQANNWYFGSGAGITFNTVPPSALSNGALNTNEGCSAMSDTAGNLLLYSNGITVWDSTHTPMLNGTGLWGGNSSTQSCLILPYPGNASTYYIITTPDAFAVNMPMAYSVVDMTMNGGLGDIFIKNVPLLDSCTEKITAVRHRNGTDIWVLTHKFESSDFYAWLLTINGIVAAPVISTAGTYIGTNSGNKVGCLKASPCGDKLAHVAYNNNTIEMFDFNDSTGTVSNAVLLGNWPDMVNGGLYGVEFSPDGSRLYTSMNGTGEILQYNLLAGSPSAIIASLNTIGVSTPSASTLQIGPDDKIYISKHSQNSLDCIQNPNVLGAGSNFLPNAVALTSTMSHGLPNFLTSNFCNLNTGTVEPGPENSIASIFPNPTRGNFTIQFSHSIPSGKIEIYNGRGELVHQESIRFSVQKEIHIDTLSSGIYLVKVVDGANHYSEKILVHND